MDTIYKYLVSIIKPGNYWFIYQQINGSNPIVYINCEPKKPEGYTVIKQIKISCDLKFEELIDIKIDELHYACQCVDKCKNICNPPRFRGNYQIYDRFGMLSTVDIDLYYTLSPLARYDHSNLYNLDMLKSKYDVLFWVKWKTNKVKFIDKDYVDGLPMYDFDTAKKILSVCSDIPKVVFISKVEISDTIKTLIDMSKEVYIKNKVIKIYI